MKARWAWLAFGLLLLGVVVGYWQASVAMRQLVQQPFAAMFFSRSSLTGTLLEVSANLEPVQAAGRQVVQPWGALKLKKVFPATEPPATPPIPTAESEKRTDLQIQ